MTVHDDLAALRDWTEDAVHAETVRRVEAEVVLQTVCATGFESKASFYRERAEAAEARVSELEVALRYYADPGSWDEDGRAWLGDYWGEDDEDRGRVARAALAADRTEEGEANEPA